MTARKRTVKTLTDAVYLIDARIVEQVVNLEMTLKSLTTNLNTLQKKATGIESLLNSLNVTVSGLADAARDNTDTTPEQLEEYRTKIAHMIVSGKFDGARDFLQSVYGGSKERGFISKKQMAAVDRIESRGSAPIAGEQEYYGDDPWWER